jgi:uncharacterized membrane protein
MLKNISLAILVVGYIAAGVNHFLNPDGYISIIPGYLPNPDQLNNISGGLEILFGILLIFPATRNWGVTGLIILLALFMPVHVAMLKTAPLFIGGILVTPFLAWVRLFLQPVLMVWVGWHMQKTKRRA